MHLVFVYGTLKGMSSAKNFGLAKTKEAYRLYDGGFPMLRPPVPGDNKIGPVIGELHRVDDEHLKHLDSYEGHPSFFKREKVSIVCNGEVDPTLMDGEVGYAEAWMYFGPENTGNRAQITPNEEGELSWPTR